MVALGVVIDLAEGSLPRVVLVLESLAWGALPWESMDLSGNVEGLSLGQCQGLLL